MIFLICRLIKHDFGLHFAVLWHADDAGFLRSMMIYNCLLSNGTRMIRIKRIFTDLLIIKNNSKIRIIRVQIKFIQKKIISQNLL